mmetsp:Transcript_20622/g.29410  ORF Transcript_20622/g.29410 Transcript_20622/m.29410 type:complete len:119 (-) Transcript_20622:129-485(-)
MTAKSQFVLISSCCLVASIAVCYAVFSCEIRRRNQKKNHEEATDSKSKPRNGDKENPDEQDTRNETCDKSLAFPWEPSRIEVETLVDTTTQDEKLIDLLSNMTFASFSLREPSCPCCK